MIFIWAEGHKRKMEVKVNAKGRKGEKTIMPMINLKRI